jgi:hypothetical protein
VRQYRFSLNLFTFRWKPSIPPVRDCTARFVFSYARPISDYVQSVSPSFWIRAQIVCLLFTPLAAIGFIALLNSLAAMLGKSFGHFRKQLR